MLIPQAIVQQSLPGDAWTTIVKAADESVNTSTVLQNDDDFFFTTVSGTPYLIEAYLNYVSPVGAGAGDLKVAFGEDATARGGAVSLGFSNTDAVVHVSILCDQTTTLVFGSAATNRFAHIRIAYTGGGGTFRMLWAQFTSNGNDVTIKQGSTLRYRVPA